MQNTIQESQDNDKIISLILAEHIKMARQKNIVYADDIINSLQTKVIFK